MNDKDVAEPWVMNHRGDKFFLIKMDYRENNADKR